MNVKIDVNVNLTNIEAIISRISKMMDLVRVTSSEVTTVDNKSQSIEQSLEIISNDNIDINNKEVIQVEEITTDKIRYLLTDLSKMGKYQQVKVILEKYNATKVGQIKKSDYNQIYKELKLLN